VDWWGSPGGESAHRISPRIRGARSGPRFSLHPGPDVAGVSTAGGQLRTATAIVAVNVTYAGLRLPSSLDRVKSFKTCSPHSEALPGAHDCPASSLETRCCIVNPVAGFIFPRIFKYIMDLSRIHFRPNHFRTIGSIIGGGLLLAVLMKSDELAPLHLEPTI
jgi:hypothetical protein